MKKNIKMTFIVPSFLVSILCGALWPSSSNANPTKVDESRSPNQVLEALKAGNNRFIQQKLRKDGVSKIDIARLSHAQKPRAAVISCADSRVPPEIIFDQKLGEMFTVRTAGETLSPEVIASLEFAVKNLDTQLILVLGHTECGAVKAALDTMEMKEGSPTGMKDTGSVNLNQLVQDIQPRIQSIVKKSGPSQHLRVESSINAKEAAFELAKHSKLLSDAVSSGKVSIKVALYDLETGKVEFER